MNPKPSVEQREQLPFRLLARQLLWKARLSMPRRSNKPATPIFILSSPRTGSSLLGKLLSSHSEIEDLGEVLNQRIARGLNHRACGRSPVIRHIKQHLAYSRSKYAVVKLHFNHLQRRNVQLKDLFPEFPHATWILLYRNNLIEQFVSLKLATHTRVFTDRRRTDETIELNIQEWKLFVQQEQDLIASTCSYFSSCAENRHIVIDYESLSNDSTEAFYAICKNIGLPDQDVEPLTMQKQETRPISRVISNFDDVHEILEETIDSRINRFLTAYRQNNPSEIPPREQDRSEC